MTQPSRPTRREAIYGLGASLGTIAFNAMLHADASELSLSSASASASASNPLSPRRPHIASKINSCIFLMMEGGPSHIDTFDPKPKLKQLHLQEFTREGEMKSAMESGKRYYVQSPFKFQRAGQSGADIAENWEQLAGCVDDICFYRGCQVDSVNHPTAMYQMNTGNRFGGEFGRSPDNGIRGGTAYGRDHNPHAMTIWLAGGGVNAGHTIGATDETGATAIDCVHHVRDLHVTNLRLLGLDDNKLTYFHGGRFKQLSQFGGKVIDELLAS